MNKDNYDPRMVTDLDVVGCYFLNKYYIGLYKLAAQRVQEGAATTITDEYRNKINQYMVGMEKRSDLYSREFTDLHSFFQKHGAAGTMTLIDFENRLLTYFIPKNYLKSFDSRQKDGALRNIILSVVKELGNLMVDFKMIQIVVDRRDNAELTKQTITKLQGQIVDMFIVQREEYHSKFARAPVADNVSADTVNKLKSRFVEEKSKCNELRADNERAINIISALQEQIVGLEAKIKELETENRRYKSEALPHSEHTRDLKQAAKIIVESDDDEEETDRMRRQKIAELAKNRKESKEKKPEVVPENTPTTDMSALLEDDTWGI